MPAWITSNKTEFENGESVQLTFAANAGFINRSVTLIAVSDEINELSAEIELTQLFNSAVVGYIDVEIDDVTFEGADLSERINVSSYDGDFNFTINYTVGADFLTVTKLLNNSQIRIEADINGTATAREAIITLSLISNPAITKDIYVTQLGNSGVSSISIDGANPRLVTNNPQNIEVNVLAPSGLSHGVFSNRSWIVVTNTIVNGNILRTIYIAKNASSSSRNGSITFYSTVNPSNAVTLTIIQGGTLIE